MLEFDCPVSIQVGSKHNLKVIVFRLKFRRSIHDAKDEKFKHEFDIFYIKILAKSEVMAHTLCALKKSL